MSKRTKIILVMDIAIGIALAVIAVAIHVDYYSTLIFSMGFALVLGSVWQLAKDYHHTRPENAEAYREKIRQQEIDLNDERKIQLRHRAGYRTWEITMVALFAASFLAALLRAGTMTVCILAGAAAAEYIVAAIIYCKFRIMSTTCTEI